MAGRSNRRKLQEAQITVGSTAASGTTGASGNAASFDFVTYYINLTTLTAGSITFVIQTSFDGTNWADLATAEMTGDTGAVAATGVKHVSSNAPIGWSCRLKYTIVTGPAAFTVDPVFSKGGSVFG